MPGSTYGDRSDTRVFTVQNGAVAIRFNPAPVLVSVGSTATATIHRDPSFSTHGGLSGRWSLRFGGSRPMPRIVAFPPYELDLGAEQLRVGGQAVPLRRKTFAVLRHLAERPGQLVTIDDLLAAVWPDVAVGRGLPKDSILEVRRALGEGARGGRIIETVRGRGYRFVAPVGQVSMGLEPGVAPTSLVGRDVEMAWLQSCLARALAGERQVLFVCGEAGIGKTSLVDAFRHRNTATVWDGHGQCIEHFGPSEAYMPVLEALARLCRGPQAEGLIAALRARAPSWVAQMPQGLGGGAEEAPPQPPSDAVRARMLRELGDAIDTLTTDRPLVLTLEDLHWSDPSTLELLSVLARRRAPARLVVLATYRPTDRLANGHPLRAVVQELRLHRHCQEIRLPFLNELQVVQYVAWRFAAADRHWVDPLGRVVHARTDGNPLFMVNVLDDLVSRGMLARVDGRWDLTAPIDALEQSVPTDIRLMIERQLDHLAGDDQMLLAAASVAGRECAAATVAAGLDLAVSDVEARAASLVRREQFLGSAGSVAWPDGTVSECFAFLHTLYRETVYARLPASRRVELHRRIGERLERAFAARPRDVAAELGLHFHRAADFERAITYERMAARNARARHAYREAASHLRNAIAALQSLPESAERDQRELGLQTALALPLIATRSEASPEVENVLTRAFALSARTGDAKQLPIALLGQWGLRFARGELVAAREIAAYLFPLAERSGDEGVLRRAHQALGFTAAYMGNLIEAEHHLELGASRRAGGAATHPGARVEALRTMVDPQVEFYRFVVACQRGRVDFGLEQLAAAVRACRESDNAYALATASGFMSMVHAMRGEVDGARTCADEALGLAREHGFAQSVGLATMLRGWARVAAGEGADALAELEAGIADWRSTGMAVGLTSMLHLLADAHQRAGRRREALAVIEEALAIVEESEERVLESGLLRLRGELLAPDDDTAAAHAFDRALAVARAHGARLDQLRAAAGRARLWIRRRQRAKARRLLVAACAEMTEGAGIPDVAAARALLADLSR